MKTKLLHLCWIIIITGCPKIEYRSGNKFNERPVEVMVGSKPDRWLAGDSIEIVMKCKVGAENIIPVNSIIYIPNIRSIVNLESGIITRVLWATDSVPFLEADRKSLVVRGIFEKAEDSIWVASSEKYDILQDSLGYYYFQVDKSSYQIDTFPLE